MTAPRARLAALAVLVASALGCASQHRPAAAGLDAVAERYVRLVLAMGRHDKDYVDAYYGPKPWKEEAERDSVPLVVILRTADSLAAALGSTPPAGADELTGLRHRYLERQLQALAARARMLSGEKLSFDQESQALYDAVAPTLPDSAFAPALARIDSLLPGKGPLADRWDVFQKAFMIPPAKLDTVFRVAIAEARRRTRAHLTLPDSESFTVEYVKHQPWGGYNWYQGGYRSLIQVNTDLPIYLDHVLGLACHEGYPGHHVYNMLLEQALVRERGWKEFTVYALFSPQSLIAEGTAVVAPDVAFPGQERARFEKHVLCPLAGLDTSRYGRYEQVHDAIDSLSMANIQAVRRWLDGRSSREETVQWLMRNDLRTRERAEKDLSFAERYRSYVVNYGLGRRMVLAWLAANGGDAAHPDRRWQLYQTLLASPRLPQDLVPQPLTASR